MRVIAVPRVRAQSGLEPDPPLRRAEAPLTPGSELTGWPPAETLTGERASRVARGPVRMFLVVDQALVREGVERFLERRGRYRVVGVAEDLRAALPAIHASLAELVLCAFYREAAPALPRILSLKAALPGCRVLLLEEHLEPDWRAALCAGGVDAVLPAGAHPDELLLALDAIHRGYPYLSPALAGRLGPIGRPSSEDGRR